MSDNNKKVEKKAMIAVVVLVLVLIVLVSSVAFFLSAALDGGGDWSFDSLIGTVTSLFAGADEPPPPVATPTLPPSPTPPAIPSPAPTTPAAPPEATPAPAPEGLMAAIIGTWRCMDDSQPHLWMCVLIFQEDGRFIDNDGDVGTFIIEGDALTFDFDLFLPITLNFSISGDRLTLTGDGLFVVLDRQ